MKAYKHEAITPPRRAVICEHGIIVLGGKEYRIDGEPKQAAALAKDENQIMEALEKICSLEAKWVGVLSK